MRPNAMDNFRIRIMHLKFRVLGLIDSVTLLFKSRETLLREIASLEKEEQRLQEQAFARRQSLIESIRKGDMA